MSDSLAGELAALRKAVEAVPAEDRPGALIPEALTGEEHGQGLDPEQRWVELDRHRGPVSGLRVLVLGGDVADDARAFAARDADYVAACQATDRSVRSGDHGSANGSTAGVEWVQLSALDPASDGTFDVVHCGELLHRVSEPMALLRKLRELTVAGGTLLISSMMLADPERSEYLRFVPTHYAGDSSWWFVPGRLALRWLLHCAGFEVQEEFGERECPRDGFPVVCGYLRAVAVEIPVR